MASSAHGPRKQTANGSICQHATSGPRPTARRRGGPILAWCRTGRRRRTNAHHRGPPQDPSGGPLSLGVGDRTGGAGRGYWLDTAICPPGPLGGVIPCTGLAEHAWGCRAWRVQGRGRLGAAVPNEKGKERRDLCPTTATSRYKTCSQGVHDLPGTAPESWTQGCLAPLIPPSRPAPAGYRGGASVSRSRNRTRRRGTKIET